MEGFREENTTLAEDSGKAAKQSRRGIIPWFPPISFNQAVRYSKADEAHLLGRGKHQESAQNLEELNFKPETVAMIIGPEGGLKIRGGTG